MLFLWKLVIVLSARLPWQKLIASKDAVQKLATFFKNVIFEKLESQFTIIHNTDIVNWPASCANFWTASFCGAKTSAGLFTADILGGGGTDAAGYKPSDVCTLTVHLAQLAYKLEFNSVQGRTLLNDWHRMENLKSAWCILNASTEGRGIKAHDVCIKTVHTARF